MISNYVISSPHLYTYKISGRTTMSVVFIGRLYFVFDKSAVGYPKWVIWVLIFLVIVSFALFLSAGFIFLEIAKYGDESVNMFIISNVFDIFLSLFLMYLFLNRLFKVLGLQGSGANSKAILNLVRVVTKYSVVVSWALISTSLTIIYASIAFQGEQKLSVYNGYEFALTIDSFINGICLYLNYPFGKRLYVKLCKNCDKCFEGICVKIASMSIKQ